MASYMSLLALSAVALLVARGSAESPPILEPPTYIAVEPPIVDIGLPVIAVEPPPMEIVEIGDPVIAPSDPDPAYACSDLMPAARCKKIAVKKGYCKVKFLKKPKGNKKGWYARNCKHTCGLCEYDNDGKKKGWTIQPRK